LAALLEAAVVADAVDTLSLMAITEDKSLKMTPSPASWNVMFPVIVPPALGRAAVYKRMVNLSDEKLQGILSKDKSCFQSWLDLETKILSSADLNKKYDKRVDWKLEGPWLERVWAWSEDLNAKKTRQEAMAIWQRISEKAPQDSFEWRMAKTRLDPNKTEFESLWK
jgi:hypothetical protein